MKKSILTVCIVSLIAFNSFAQNKQQHKNPMGGFTPDQKVALMVKKLSLNLDLTSKQQEKLKPLFLEAQNEKAAAHKNHSEMRNLSNDEKFAKMNEMLDKRIAFQGKVKQILSEDQFEKWQKMAAHHQQKRRPQDGAKDQRGKDQKRKGLKDQRES